MDSYPLLLTSPHDVKYNLEEEELYYIKECADLTSIKKYSYALLAMWNSVIINLQRRVEYFGIEIFLKKIDDEDNYDKNGNNLKDRWLNINEFKILEYCRKINIINHTTNSLLETLFWMKSNTNEQENKELTEKEVLSLIFLIQKNLFEKKFKSDMRGKDPLIKNTKVKFRRKSDNKADSNKVPNTHQNLMMLSGAKLFQENDKPITPSKKLIDEYI